MASNRAMAKKVVLDLLKEHRIYDPRLVRTDFEAHCAIHDALEEFGYQNAGTRRCIINEAFREAGLAPDRDSFRAKTYRFEDHRLVPVLGPAVTAQREVTALEATLQGLCHALMWKGPSLEVAKGGKVSKAYGSSRITLAPRMLDHLTLCHELAHCWGYYTHQLRNHCDRFVGIELAFLAYLGYSTIEEMAYIASTSGIKVDVALAERTLTMMQAAGEQSSGV